MRSVHIEYWNPWGVPLVFIAPDVVSIQPAQCPDTHQEQGTVLAFEIAADDGLAAGDFYAFQTYTEVRNMMSESDRTGKAIVLSGQIMKERHPLSGRCWLLGNVRVLCAEEQPA